MDKKTLKTYLLLISFTIGLVLVVVHFETILGGIGVFLRLLTPLFIGVVIAFVLNRPYEWLNRLYREKCRLKPRAAQILAVVTVYLLAFGILTLLVCMVVPELIRNLQLFAASVNQYLLEAQAMLNGFTETFGLPPVDLSDFINTVSQYLGTLSSFINEMIPQIVEVTGGFISGVVTAFISIILSVYLLSGKDRLLMQLRRTLKVYLPNRAHAFFGRLYRIVAQVFGDYVAGQCKEAVILGVLCFIGMSLLRLDYAALISTVIAVTALIPMLGAYIGGAVGVVLLLFISPVKALIFLVFLIVLQQVEGNVIYPKVVGRKIGLPGLWVLLGITVGGGLFGIWGMLLAVPIASVVYQVIKKDVKKREEESAPQDIEEK
ncbi:MAG TPA: AI-2E family transporter [Candidatus Merdivicinus excrementipullorum]|uniref:AI-2E family transporter n=1 Tax=Candidatus Merdivicinus excrementipullorum TaxID=2840867 RepID=A0A9D1K1C6_9FIRM|nr:AI-2E family transporter [Candidatus Merdivicinus excrementipullorum]